jgi:dipeptidase E
LGVLGLIALPSIDEEVSAKPTVTRPAAAVECDETAIKVTDGTVEVVSEGHWKLFSP